jgi:hypothetical protein
MIPYEEEEERAERIGEVKESLAKLVNADPDLD